MSRFTLVGAAAGLLLLVGWCYGPAIAGRQFSYRDAAHYYYPLYQRVEAEWDAGRVPLWEPEENAGMPLLGNPTAAVLYPGKAIYRALPYPLAARVYVIFHTLLAFAGTAVLARTLGIGGAGASIAALAYAFGAPILFQYCNVIYLVGAAWVPWAFVGLDGWLRLDRRWGLVLLAVVLAMQVLGGDPQAAYLEGLAGGAYAILMGRKEREGGDRRAGRALLVGFAVVAGLAVWVGVTLGLAAYLPTIRPKAPPTVNAGQPPSFVWNRYLPAAVAGCWAVAGLVFIGRWMRGRPGASRLGRRLAGLAAAAVLAGLLAGAQLLPVLEYTRLTGRSADEGTHDIYPFSLEPYRALELALPNLFGTLDRGNHSWLTLIPPLQNHRIWVPSLYVGGMTVVLALAGLFGRGGPPWRAWFGGIAALSLLASFGEFAGPLWLARNAESLSATIGPHDPGNTNPIRLDGYLRDGDGSFYSIVSSLIPGFQQFRYPSKLLTFTVLGLAILSGLGWDRVASGRSRSVPAWGGLLIALGVAAAVGVQLRREELVAFFARYGHATLFGPMDAGGAFSDLRWALIQGACSFGVVVVGALLAGRWPRPAGAFVVLALAADLAWANGRLVATADQADFDRVPKAIEVIARAEEANPSPGPFRVHRAAIWHPTSWTMRASGDRVLDFVRWERDTVQPKYGLAYGLHYTHTQGVAELFDYEWFFGPFSLEPSAEVMRLLGLTDPKEKVVYFPRRGFDLWNTRYFILPGLTRWGDSERGVASLVSETTPIYPGPSAFEGPDAAKKKEEWALDEDLQILRNLAALPRAWVVHEARFLKPVDGLSREVRKGPMEEIVYKGDPFWNDSRRIAHDPRTLAWLEVEESAPLARYLPKGPPVASEAVTVRLASPTRTDLDVTLERPGLVILADAYYPGWDLTVDGRAAPILRANRMMRGAAVEAGPHKLVYEFRSRSFANGKILSLAGLVALLVMGGWAAPARKSTDPSTDPGTSP